MELRPARGSERDQVLDLLARWYGDRDFFARYNHHDPRFRDDLCLVACENGRIVATAQIFDRIVNLCGARVPLGGVGSVYTSEHYRGRGIGSGLMQLAVTTMEREGFEISLLFAERLDFYARFGWRPVTRRFSALTNSQSIHTPGGFQLARFEQTRDLEEVAAIHRSYSGRLNGTVLRDLVEWRGNLRYAGNPGEYFVVCRRTGVDGLVAYARAMLFYGFPMVMEYGYVPGAVDAMLVLMRHIGEVASGGTPSIPLENGAGGEPATLRNPANPPAPALLVTHSAHDSAFEESLRAAGATVMHHRDNFFMWRVVAPHRLGNRLGVVAGEAESALFATLQASNALYWTADRF